MRNNRSIYLSDSPQLSRGEARMRYGVLSSWRAFRSWGILVDEMTDVEAGKVWKMLFTYVKDKPIPAAEIDQLSDLARTFLMMVINSIEDCADREIGKAMLAGSSKRAKQPEPTAKQPKIPETQPENEETETDENGID